MSGGLASLLTGLYWYHGCVPVKRLGFNHSEALFRWMFNRSGVQLPRCGFKDQRRGPRFIVKMSPGPACVKLWPYYVWQTCPMVTILWDAPRPSGRFTTLCIDLPLKASENTRWGGGRPLQAPRGKTCCVAVAFLSFNVPWNEDRAHRPTCHH